MSKGICPYTSPYSCEKSLQDYSVESGHNTFQYNRLLHILQQWLQKEHRSDFELMSTSLILLLLHGDVIKWKHFPRYWPFVRGIHRSPVNFPHKGQWRRALMFTLICVWINDWVNNREAGDLRCHHAHYDVTVMGEVMGVIGAYSGYNWPWYSKTWLYINWFISTNPRQSPAVGRYCK